MAKRKSRIPNSVKTVIQVFCILFICIAGFVAFRYYRQYAYQVELKRQERLSKVNFIKKLVPVARQVDKAYGILPSVTLAQACVESDFGQSQLAQKYNNLFGVKGTNKATTALMTTKEYVNGKWITIKARFQIYDSYEAAVRAHAELIKNGTTWNSKQYIHVLKADNYVAQAKALVKDGYATDPNYAGKLINMIRQYKLYKYDK
ncbi:MAG: glycoside hydrolase family 73 protein [Lactobacillus sp.]|nr:glycoside hydrolase family 73 protein [Lactobacillus sp.]